MINPRPRGWAVSAVNPTPGSLRRRYRHELVSEL